MPRPSLLERGEVLERTTSRLRHLCTLIARDRQPYCPVNGLLVLLPFAASDDELTAGQTAVLLERDLATVRQTLEVRCPLVTLVCDMENTPGGRELLDRFPERFDLTVPYFVGQNRLNGASPRGEKEEWCWTQPEGAPPKRTALFDTHRAMGAKIVPFAGWEMPVWYTSVGAEHAAVRQTAGPATSKHPM